MLKKYLFTSESVTEGHPDKVCDLVSDSILDAILSKDKNARVACETMVTMGKVIVSGEITTSNPINYKEIAINTIESIGYSEFDLNKDNGTYDVSIIIKEQSPHIAQGVNENEDKDQGAGDQLVIYCELISIKRKRFGKVKGEAKVNDQVVCSGDLMFSLVD